MYRGPGRPQQSPGASRPTGRYPSPSSSWGFHGARSPFGGFGHRGASPRGFPAYSAGSPAFSQSSERAYRDRSPAGFGRGSREFGGQMRRRGDDFRRPQWFSPNFKSSDSSVEKYFSPRMMQDPWADLQPLTAAEAASARHAA